MIHKGHKGHEKISSDGFSFRRFKFGVLCVLSEKINHLFVTFPFPNRHYN